MVGLVIEKKTCDKVYFTKFFRWTNEFHLYMSCFLLNCGKERDVSESYSVSWFESEENIVVSVKDQIEIRVLFSWSGCACF